MFTSLMSFISSAKSTYILIAIMLVASAYLWTDYQHKTKYIGELESKIEVANKGLREAAELNNANVDKFDKERQSFKEVLDALQKLHTKNRELEKTLSEQQDAFNVYKNEADDFTKKCLAMELPANVFGNLVDSNVNSLHNNKNSGSPSKTD